MAENGPLMFKVRPLYDFSPEDITLPTCMYKMDNLHECSSSGISSSEIDFQKMDLTELEKSQLIIIQKLEDLKAKVVKLKEDINANQSVSNSFEKFQDIVIKANPKYPPLSVWVFYQILSQSTPVRLVTYMHSSLMSLPDNVKPLQSVFTSQACNISLTVIWREGDKDHELVIDPINQGAIEGEVNIARYLSRLLCFNYDSDPITSTLIDNWLELVHSSIIHGNNKDRQAALRSLNAHLGKNTFLVGDSYTLGDVVAWSALIQTKLYQSLPANVLKWFKSLLSVDVFKQCVELGTL